VLTASGFFEMREQKLLMYSYLQQSIKLGNVFMCIAPRRRASSEKTRESDETYCKRMYLCG
jgi:hypothetical protein